MLKNSKSYLIAILLLTLVFNKVEHAALGVMMQDIKTDLKLSDTQLGLLTGIAFTLFYATLGVPIGRAADRGNRVGIISFTTALQCGALALSGLASNFAQLLVIRIGVAVGEAGCVAPANALIADRFDRKSRPRATSMFMLGYPLSAIAGYFLGGWLNDLVGWRTTFVLLGAPGLLLAAILFLTVRDRITAAAPAGPMAKPAAPQHPRASTARLLWSNRTYRHLVIGYSLLTFFGIGVIQWLPTFFIRSYGFSTAELGIWFALIWGVGGVVGSLAAGEWASRRAAHNEALQIKAITSVFLLSGIFGAAIYLVTSPYVAFGFVLLIAMANYGTAGPLFATIQSVVPAGSRSVAVATTYLFTNLIGVGLGPLAVGFLSDMLTPGYGDEALRYALLALCPGYLWASWHLWRASRTVASDVALENEGLPA
ncbi:spinster family MFS transporter [Rhizorhabdus dicambivorans]|nr:MFS transporter [Rhizorhabdus dicambivorans]